MQEALKKISNQIDLTNAEMQAAIRAIMQGQATPAQIGALLMGLRLKGETVTEIVAAVQVIRELAIAVDVQDSHLVDIVGTGGDGASTFNISTASAFIMATAGAKVAKHNNRAVTSHSGSADLLSVAGINPSLTPKQIAACINEVGIGFMFAPNHHISWRYTMEPRREIGVRTMFNLLGPLANPAMVKKQVIGVYSKHWVTPVVEALQQLGSTHALVVHSDDGLDEISIDAPTYVAELHQDKVNSYTIAPEDFGMKRQPLERIQVNSPTESLQLIEQAFANQPIPARNALVLNAGAGLYAADVCSSLADGIKLADTTLAAEKVADKLQALKTFTQQFHD